MSDRRLGDLPTCQCSGRGSTCGGVAGCMWPAFHPNSDHPSSVCTESLLPASLGHSILCFQTGRKEEVPTGCFQTENCTVACSVAVACLFSTIKPLAFKPSSVCAIRVQTIKCLCHTIPYQLISPRWCDLLLYDRGLHCSSRSSIFL